MKPFARKEVQSAASPVGRRNFRLSGLEILIVVLIFVGVLYLLAMWVSNAFTPEPEAAAPATPASTLIEKSLESSEKALAQLSSLNKDVATLRRDMENQQARRTQQSSGGGQALASLDPAQAQRLEEMEKQVHALQKSKEEKGLPQELKALAARLDKLDKEQAAKTADKKASPAALDGQLLARLEKLEQAAPPKEGAALAALAAQSALESRLAQLEQGLRQLKEQQAKALASPAHAAPAAPTPSAVPAELLRQQSQLSQRLEELSQAQREMAREMGQLRKTQAALLTPVPRPLPAAPEMRAEPRPALRAETKPPARPKAPEADPRRITHKVKSGETITGLARRYKITVDDIVRWNAPQLGDRRSLLIGETIVLIPGSNN